MRMYKLLNDATKILIRCNKKISYETIDFVFKPKHFYTLITIKPTEYKIPKVPYKEQYESRDF